MDSASCSSHFYIQVSWVRIFLYDNSRVIKDIDRDFLSIWPECFLDVEGPQEPSNRDERALLSQSLTTAHPPTPPESHIPSLIRERSIFGIVFEIPIRVETIRIGKLAFIVVDRPNIALNPRAFWNEISLNLVSMAY